MLSFNEPRSEESVEPADDSASPIRCPQIRIAGLAIKPVVQGAPLKSGEAQKRNAREDDIARLRRPHSNPLQKVQSNRLSVRIAFVSSGHIRMNPHPDAAPRNVPLVNSDRPYRLEKCRLHPRPVHQMMFIQETIVIVARIEQRWERGARMLRVSRARRADAKPDHLGIAVKGNVTRSETEALCPRQERQTLENLHDFA